MNLEKNVAFVTGAGRGMGEAIARRFLLDGWTVASAALESPKWDAGEFESHLIRIKMDVSKEDQVIKSINWVTQNFGCIRTLVNNAGIACQAPLTETDLIKWNKVFEVNTTGVFLCCREVVRHMLENGQSGSIINISSIAGRNAFPGSSCYSASKSAVIGLTRALAAELGPRDITVNAVCPGSVETQMIQDVIENISESSGLTQAEVRKNMESSIPMQCFQTPEDIADLVCFLGSGNARNINGETINIDGGVVRN